MGENTLLLKTWLASKPAQVDNQTILQMFKVLLRAIGETDNDIAVLQEALTALSASFAVAEDRLQKFGNRITKLEADALITQETIAQILADILILKG